MFPCRANDGLLPFANPPMLPGFGNDVGLFSVFFHGESQSIEPAINSSPYGGSAKQE
jgi:hypothetical protein